MKKSYILIICLLMFIVLAWVVPTITLANPNLLVNGSFNVNQRNCPTSQSTLYSNMYCVDRWRTYDNQQGIYNFIGMVTNNTTNVFNNYLSSVHANSGQQSMIVQILEQKDLVTISGNKASLSFWAKSGATAVAKLRAAILCWTGTADSPGSVVTGWGTNPSWGTNWSAANTPSDITISNSWVLYSIPNINVGTNCNNVAVAIWTPETPGSIPFLVEN